MKKDLGFYELIEKDLNSIFKNNLTYSEFLMSLKSFHFLYKYDFSSFLNKLEDIRKLLYKIATIINKPRINVSSSPIILRSELTKSISNESFLKTLKDSSLWKSKNNEMSPENVYTEESIDTIDIYENRFIITLIYIIQKEVDNILNEVNLASLSFKSKYKIENVLYSKLSLYNLYTPFKYPYDENFILKLDDTSYLDDLLYKCNKILKRIKSTKFYNELKDSPLIKSVVPTNILINDPLYSYLYKYYKKNYINAINMYAKEDSMYFNFVLTLFFKYFKKYDIKPLNSKKNDKIFSFNDFKIEFLPFVFKDKIFEYTFVSSPSKKEIYIDTKCLIGNLNEDERITKYKLKIVTKLTKDNYKELINEEDDSVNVIIITLFDEENIYSNVLNLTYFNDDNVDLIKNLFTSFTLLFNISQSITLNRCLGCGSKNISKDNNLIKCNKCHTKYLLFENNNKNYMLIKNLWRN